MPDKLNPAPSLKKGTRSMPTLTLKSDVATLPDNVLLKTSNEPGTLTAKDGGNNLDVDAGASSAPTRLRPPRRYR